MTTVTAVWRKVVFKRTRRKDGTAHMQHLYSEVVYTLQIRSLLPLHIVDFVSQDNNNLITIHYLKCTDSLIFVPTVEAVLWTALYTTQSKILRQWPEQYLSRYFSTPVL